MTIAFAILVLLRERPMSGYDIKKTMQTSPFMHWSGNNNQIYKALVGLTQDGCVASETVHRESSPSKKLYSITEHGASALRAWLLSEPEPPELRHPFLIRLAGAGALSDAELFGLIGRYEDEVRLRYHGQLELLTRAGFPGRGTPREAALREMLEDQVKTALQTELEWVWRLRDRLRMTPIDEGGASR